LTGYSTDAFLRRSHRRLVNELLSYLVALILSRDGVTIDGVWIGNRIYWTLALVTTINYSALKFNIARTECSESAVSSPVVAW
jgi:hypothetical protein